MNKYRYNGFINVYKESGWTSMDVCAKLKNLLKVKKIGHAGTLDPLAEGVLPLALGIATKDIDKVTSEKKEYRATMVLGLSTDTDDVTGKCLKRYEGPLPGESSILNVILSFIGEYDQLPPMYSARKINGKKLYEYARLGQVIERKPRKIRIYDIVINKIELPRVYFDVVCSKGTYIRSLIRDIGEKLSCGGCLEELTRLKVGDFYIDNALRIEEIEKLSINGQLDEVLSIKAPTACAIGKFDGTHLGHQALIEELKKVAARNGLKSLIIVFIGEKKSLSRACDIRKTISDLGVDYCIELKFTEKLKNTSAYDFLKDVLIKKYNMKTIVAGEDVSFGKDRVGDSLFLKKYSKVLGYKVKIIKKIGITKGNENFIISSSLIKKELEEGKVDDVSKFLGHDYFVEARVAESKNITTAKFGISSINLSLTGKSILPPEGAYVVSFNFFDPLKEEIVKGEGVAYLKSLTNYLSDEGSKLKTEPVLNLYSFKEINVKAGTKVKVGFIKFLFNGKL